MNAITYGTSALAPSNAADLDYYRQSFIDYCDSADKTRYTYARSVDKFLAWLGSNGITEPGRADVLAYKEHLMATMAPASVSLHLTAVRLFFRWLADNGLYANVADHVKGVKLTEGHKRDYLTAGQLGHVLETLDAGAKATADRDYCIVTLMASTGLRCVSVSLANVGDIGVAGGSEVLYYQGKGRTEKAKYVKLDPQLAADIRRYLAGRPGVKADDPLFTSTSNNSTGGRLSTRSISKLVKGALVNAGLDSARLTAHSLRHTAATLNMLAGGSVEETQQLLDHKNINTTNIYRHDLDRAANNSESRIYDAFRRARTAR